MTEPAGSDFEKASQGQKSTSVVGELWGFLMHTKKYWLLPILIVLLLFGLLIMLSGTAAAPFIYTLF
ncbi:MAG: hypothetical protein K2R98_22315 [Gemmataceae bacterium]|nr:hypothetical protein [Gemmataceae bacterium]